MKKLSAAALAVLPLAALAAKPLTVCTDANPEGFDVVQYNSLVTTNASADVLMDRLVEYDAAAGKLRPAWPAAGRSAPTACLTPFTCGPASASTAPTISSRRAS
ncbi:Uncharacterised protein [Chromobacterium violaceum]|uniref:Dipeptide-binding protein n=1 Tax=Chromobacterium violaceum TaxID=536 RepID=A0A447TI00_CHRVL|nr:Uncharacterised protein [Chromobacterium violaceum]